MAGEIIFACRYAKHPTSAISGVQAARLSPSAVKVTDPGVAGDTGEAETLVTHRAYRVTLLGTDRLALLALVGATAANLILGTIGTAGALEKITLKNAYFDEVPQAQEIPRKDGGGTVAGFAVGGSLQWGTADTFATMDVAAADA